MFSPIQDFCTSALQIAEHLLAQAATGERDFDRLKASGLNKLDDATTDTDFSSPHRI
jgi:hypothetical protein